MDQQPPPNVLHNGAAENLLEAVERGQIIPPILIPELACQMQPMLIPGAEDLELLGFMVKLIEETSCYMGFYINNFSGSFSYPEFYSTSVYYIYKLAQKRRQNPVYLETLAGVVKRRLMERFPHFAAFLPDLPSLRQIIMSSQFFEGAQGIFRTQKEQAWIKFEKVVGEAITFVGWHRQQFGVPPSLDFLFQFVILYKKYNGVGDRRQFHMVACNYLRRSLPHVGQEFFQSFSQALQRALAIERLSVTFS